MNTQDLQRLSLQEAIENYYAGLFVTTDFHAFEEKVDISHFHYCSKCGVKEMCDLEECQDIANLFCKTCVDITIAEAILEVTVNDYSIMIKEFEKVEKESMEVLKKLKDVLALIPTFDKGLPF